jgi:4a-hydroxytetrahydrobiopterin dehydratase
LEARSLANRVRVGKRTSVSLLPRKNPLLFREAMSSILSAKEIKEAIKDLPEWDVEGKAIVRVFEFEDFEQAIDFVNGVAELAEDADHHPDMDIRYNKVRVILSTHSKGGITESDFDLAERLDTLVDA